MEPLRVLHVIPNLKRGGAERMVLDTCRALSQRDNVQVKLLLLEESIDYPELLGEVDYEITTSRYLPSIMGRGIRDMEHYYQLLKSFQPDIIHSHLFQAEMFVRANVWPEAKYFCHFHNKMDQFQKLGIKTLRRKQNLTRFYERSLLMRSYRKHPTNFIAISKDVKKYVEPLLPEKSGTVSLLPNAIDLSRFQPTMEKNVSKTSLISVGRIDANKNHVFLLKVINWIREEIPGVHLTIVGEGPDESLIKRRIVEMGLNRNVTMVGQKNRPEELLQESAIYVHSALEEGFGLTIVEAMACGLPVVALDSGGNREIVEDGKNGFLLKYDDPESFGRRVLSLMEDQSLYERLQEEALATAQQYDMRCYVSKLLDLYQEAKAEAGHMQNS